MNLIIVIYELLRISLIGIQKGVFFKPTGKKLASYLESLGPIFTKFGQLLSTRTDILDSETAKDLESLTDSCKPFNVETLKKIVESELGDSIENIFESFEKDVKTISKSLSLSKSAIEGEPMILPDPANISSKSPVFPNMYNLPSYVPNIISFNPSLFISPTAGLDLILSDA